MFQPISMTSHYIPLLVIFEKVSDNNIKSKLGFLLSWSHVPWKVQKLWWGLAFRSWNSPVPTPESWHTWSQLEMGLCRCIPEAMFPTCDLIGRESSSTWRDHTTLIWHIPDVWNSYTYANWTIIFSTTRYLMRSAHSCSNSGWNWYWWCTHSLYSSNLQPVPAILSLHCLSAFAVWWIASATARIR